MPTKFNVKLSDEHYDLLQHLADQLGVDMAQVVRDGLELMAEATDAILRKEELGRLRADGHFTELRVMALGALRRQAGTQRLRPGPSPGP